MNKQEIFDRVARHLLTQNERSLMKAGDYESGCAYRDARGLKCAVGCLIEDDEYDSFFEGRSVSEVLHPSDSLFEKFHRHEELLVKLQRVHDQTPPWSWAKQLQRIAEDCGLSNTILQELAKDDKARSL